ncbi:nickel-dependent lactate racemase [Anaeromusa sp.]|mgnify:FL=1|uniref:nickel-dependent lactate racemase n=1 Tax=Anaeromusa sp. TaxID=1872520 RepID=UPI0026176D10|nr:nickel-dependent lactate racemase [Anaeromusa sp.]MDD3157882.1 nickel-dependent lactate racemase [Anaeromusa sp.]NCB77531.1 nickel-dependent lactate racemase [Negativicutes bacterium]
MAVVKIPYSKGFIEAQFDDARLVGVLESKAHHYKPEAGEQELVKKALENPIGSPRLRDLVKGKNKIVIIASDHTRPVPSKIMAPIMLEEIRSGNPEADITFLIATGFHRPTTKEELIGKFGEKVVAEEKIVVHNAFEPEAMVNIGKLPSGGDIVINKLAVEADLLISEGFIEPHFFAGFSGGRKSVLPGVVSKVTVLANHNSRFIASDKARTGNLEGNPIHIDMLHAAKTAKLQFILNVVIDADKKIIKAFAGDLEKAHAEGTKFAGELANVAAKPADIAITSNGGYPLDQNIYQAVKGMSAAEATCRKGGVIIICAACNDGHGGEDFYEWFKKAESAQAVMDEIMAIEPQHTLPDQWEAQILARILIDHTVIMVTDQCDHSMITDMKMKVANTLPEAMKMAEEIVGKDASITVVPDGVSVIVK